MTKNYPQSWSGLEHPELRAELISCLQLLFTYQQPDDAKYLMFFVLEDNDFQPASKQLGSILLDVDEANAVGEFVDALASALEPRGKPHSSITPKEWTSVMAAAGDALDCLERKGVPEIEK